MEKTNCIKAVLFDFDGTLTCPGVLDWAVIKNEIGCPLDRPALEFIDSLPEDEQKTSMEKLDRFEYSGAIRSRPNEGAEEIIPELRARGISLAIISRNSLQCIHLALDNFENIGISDFEFIISRDDPILPKPNPDGVLLAVRKFGLEPEEVMLVGDYVIDIQAGNAAGVTTVFLDSQQSPLPPGIISDHKIYRLSELLEIVEWRIPLPVL